MEKKIQTIQLNIAHFKIIMHIHQEEDFTYFLQEFSEFLIVFFTLTQLPPVHQYIIRKIVIIILKKNK